MNDVQHGDNVRAFLNAGMLSAEAVANLTPAQVEAIASWSPEKVQEVIGLYKQTGEIKYGVRWI